MLSKKLVEICLKVLRYKNIHVVIYIRAFIYCKRNIEQENTPQKMNTFEVYLK